VNKLKAGKPEATDFKEDSTNISKVPEVKYNNYFPNGRHFTFYQSR
jgi:hypothetical protein